MRTLKNLTMARGTLIADYAAKMSEAMARKSAERAVRQARLEVDRAVRARSEFLANMNHELRTPLNAIVGFATMLRDMERYELSDDQHREYAEYILQSADLLLGHINTILELAALESGGVKLKSDEVDCRHVLEAAIERAKVRAGAAKVKLQRRDDGDEEIYGWGDAQRTGQAIDHLLRAAIKACGEGGKVLVRVVIDEQGWPEFAIRDNGSGFSSEEIEKALAAFEEGREGLDRAFSGPGVGYAIAKNFTELQGGRFSIKSRPGQGTLVTIALPPPSAGAWQNDARVENCQSSNAENVDDAA